MSMSPLTRSDPIGEGKPRDGHTVPQRLHVIAHFRLQHCRPEREVRPAGSREPMQWRDAPPSSDACGTGLHSTRLSA